MESTIQGHGREESLIQRDRREESPLHRREESPKHSHRDTAWRGVQE